MKFPGQNLLRILGQYVYIVSNTMELVWGLQCHTHLIILSSCVIRAATYTCPFYKFVALVKESWLNIFNSG